MVDVKQICKASLLSGFAVYSPLTLMSPAIMGLSTVSWYSASPWWSDVEFAIDLFFSQYKFLRLTALITQFLFFYQRLMFNLIDFLSLKN